MCVCVCIYTYISNWEFNLRVQLSKTDQLHYWIQSKNPMVQLLFTGSNVVTQFSIPLSQQLLQSVIVNFATDFITFGVTILTARLLVHIMILHHLGTLRRSDNT